MRLTLGNDSSSSHADQEPDEHDSFGIDNSQLHCVCKNEFAENGDAVSRVFDDDDGKGGARRGWGKNFAPSVLYFP